MPPKIRAAKATSSHDIEIQCGLGVVLKTEVHVQQHPADPEAISNLRKELNADSEAADLLSKFSEPQCSIPLGDPFGFCTDACLWRFLIANKGQVTEAKKQLLDALQLRDHRRPDLCRAADIEVEGLTGKIYRPGWDRWGRPVIVFNSAKENTKSVDDQMRFLAWNLECATRTMDGNVEKYLIFIHMEEFSLFGAPPFAATKETIHLLQTCFAERLGHTILYQAPRAFSTFWNMLKFLVDPKTASKMIFVNGDVSDGSANDAMLRELVADEWKLICGVEQPVYAQGCSPGFNYDEYWPTVLEEEQIWLKSCDELQMQAKTLRT